MKKPIQIRVEETDLQAWKKRAEEAGKDLSEWIRGRCNQNGEDVQRDPAVRVVEGRVGVSERAAVDLAAIAEDTAAKRKEYGSLEQRVARRTGHPVGHSCMECMGAYRFEENLEKQDKKEKPEKKGRR